MQSLINRCRVNNRASRFLEDLFCTQTRLLANSLQDQGADSSLEYADHSVPLTTNTADVPPEEQKLLQAGIVGVPNAGKSTLTNALVGNMVSAVSPKTNTTVKTRLGAFTVGPSQVVLYDTPGVVDTRHVKNQGQEQRVRSAWTIAHNCDVLLFIIDAHRQLIKPDPRVIRLVEDYSSGIPPSGFSGDDWDPPPSVLVLNKVDAVLKDDRPALLRMADEFQQLTRFEDIFWISALKGRGVDDLREYLINKATPGQWTVDKDEATNMSKEEVALEMVREKIFCRFYEELPYEITLRPVSFKILKDGAYRIEQNVMVPTESVRKIIVGRQGSAIGAVGRMARLDLERLWDRPVHLMLNVKREK